MYVTDLFVWMKIQFKSSHLFKSSERQLSIGGG